MAMLNLINFVHEQFLTPSYFTLFQLAEDNNKVSVLHTPEQSILVPCFEQASEAYTDGAMPSLYEISALDAASAVDYSKGNIDDGVVNSPPPKRVFVHVASPSPLKKAHRPDRRLSPSRSNGPRDLVPHRRLRMDVHADGTNPSSFVAHGPPIQREGPSLPVVAGKETPIVVGTDIEKPNSEVRNHSLVFFLSFRLLSAFLFFCMC